MDNIYISVLTATLNTLSVSYLFDEDILIIRPLDLALLEVLPGEIVRVEDHTELQLNIKTFDLPEWIAQQITQLTQTV